MFSPGYVSDISLVSSHSCGLLAWPSYRNFVHRGAETDSSAAGGAQLLRSFDRKQSTMRLLFWQFEDSRLAKQVLSKGGVMATNRRREGLVTKQRIEEKTNVDPVCNAQP